MNRTVLGLVALAMAISAFSCEPKPVVLTDAQKSAIADTAKGVVQEMITDANKLDFAAAFKLMTADGRYVENGFLYPSLDTMKKSYDEVGPLFESLQNIVDTWDVMVLGQDAVAVTAPFHFTFKPKGRPEYKAQGIWSGIVQRRGGSWKIVQSHESWVNAQDAMAALIPPPAKQKGGKK